MECREPDLLVSVPHSGVKSAPAQGRLAAQAGRDLLYGAIVVVCFLLGVGLAVAAVALAHPVLEAVMTG